MEYIKILCIVFLSRLRKLIKWEIYYNTRTNETHGLDTRLTDCSEHVTVFPA